MRYVCTTCGEGDLWKATDSRRISSLTNDGEERYRDSSSSLPSPSISTASDESELTEWAGGNTISTGRPGGAEYRGRSASMSTRASREAVSGRGAGSDQASEAGGRGFELCPSCIETHGIAHAKAAASADKRSRSDQAVEGVRRRSELRHCFREKIWGPEGWSDIGQCFCSVWASDTGLTDDQSTMKRWNARYVGLIWFKIGTSVSRAPNSISVALVSATSYKSKPS